MNSDSSSIPNNNLLTDNKGQNEQDVYSYKSQNRVSSPAPDIVRSKNKAPVISKKSTSGNGNGNSSNDFKNMYGLDAEIKYKNPPLPSLEGTVGQWYLLTETGIDGIKKCYAVSYPYDSIGNHKMERKPYIMIVVTKNKLIPFIATGYEFAYSSKAFVSIDGSQFDLMTNNYIATTSDLGQEFEFVKSMMSSSRVFVYARSIVGSYSVDSYSLENFIDAYKRIVKLCEKH